MESLHRLFALDGLLRNSRYPVPAQRLRDELECSPATLKRLIHQLREIYSIPIRYCRKRGGYHYDTDEQINIPGLWFTHAELHALLTMRQLLERSQPGILDEHFRELGERVDRLLAAGGQAPNRLVEKLRIVPVAHQAIQADIFEPVARGVLEGRRLHLRYCDIKGSLTERDVSPLRLVYYRDHWYLDAWCHLRDGLRVFWLSGVESVAMLDQPAREVDAGSLDQYVEPGYGIFAGAVSATAHMRFSGLAAMRVRGAQWHPRQRQQINKDGTLELWIPYSDERELLMDILRYGPEVTVLGPESLKDAVIGRLSAAINNYK